MEDRTCRRKLEQGPSANHERQIADHDRLSADHHPQKRTFSASCCLNATSMSLLSGGMFTES